MMSQGKIFTIKSQKNLQDFNYPTVVFGEKNDYEDIVQIGFQSAYLADQYRADNGSSWLFPVRRMYRNGDCFIARWKK
jgi:hypothetical protein